MRSVVTEISWLLILLLAGEREAQRARITAVQTQCLLQPLLLQPQRFCEIGTELLRRLRLVALVVTVVTQGVRVVLLIQLR